MNWLITTTLLYLPACLAASDLNISFFVRQWENNSFVNSTTKQLKSCFFFLSLYSCRSVLPLLQPGLAGFLLRLRLPAGDQGAASGGDRRTVRKPAVFLRSVWLGRGPAGGIHPGQRLQLPPLRQRRLRRGLRDEGLGGIFFSFFLCVLSEELRVPW